MKHNHQYLYVDGKLSVGTAECKTLAVALKQNQKNRNDN